MGCSQEFLPAPRIKFVILRVKETSCRLEGLGTCEQEVTDGGQGMVTLLRAGHLANKYSPQNIEMLGKIS
jgi:hypothetical protein